MISLICLLLPMPCSLRLTYFSYLFPSFLPGTFTFQPTEQLPLPRIISWISASMCLMCCFLISSSNLSPNAPSSIEHSLIRLLPTNYVAAVSIPQTISLLPFMVCLFTISTYLNFPSSRVHSLRKKIQKDFFLNILLLT